MFPKKKKTLRKLDEKSLKEFLLMFTFNEVKKFLDHSLVLSMLELESRFEL